MAERVADQADATKAVSHQPSAISRNGCAEVAGRIDITKLLLTH
jgi:hypothetical protein